MRRRHSMPFGAECSPDGSVRFRLWAPAVQTVDLSLQQKPRTLRLPMEKRDDGWFELQTEEAGAGSRYNFRIDGFQEVPDPASRFQPNDVHGPSEVIDPAAFDWKDNSWTGRRWEDAVIYELHVGAFTSEGTFSAVQRRLDYLVDLGVSALELMPVSDFRGRRNWGYDGVLPFAPECHYGPPEDLKALIQAAHERELMVFLDVVYNHFGPDGNNLRVYSPQFFTERHHTPWGHGLNFDRPASRTVRDFFIHNALYWLNEYHFDGLRLDAVHAIVDDSTPNILTELAQVVRSDTGNTRHVHLILENDHNQSRYLRRNKDSTVPLYTAQWNDDFHHAIHVLITGEHDGYYSDYADRPLDRLGRCLTEGFAYQGEASKFRNGAPRGEPTTGLPPSAFVSFLQNHDQIGNRAFGERIACLADPRALHLAIATLLLSPSPPLLFMGEEYGADTPFLFFCDFDGDLAKAVTMGRRNEFARFEEFKDPTQRDRIPDPNADRTFELSKLDWEEADKPSHRDWRLRYQELLRLRRKHIAPRISRACTSSTYRLHGQHGLVAHWEFAGKSTLVLAACIGPEGAPQLPRIAGQLIYTVGDVTEENLQQGTLPPWSLAWVLA